MNKLPRKFAINEKVRITILPYIINCTGIILEVQKRIKHENQYKVEITEPKDHCINTISQCEEKYLTKF